MTAHDLARRILLSIGVIGESDTPTAEQINDTFVSMNQFLSSLGSEGFVTYQYANPSDDIALDDGWEAMIQTNVAVMIAPDYGKEAAQSVQSRAMNTKRVLKKTMTPIPVLNIAPIVFMGRNRQWTTYDVFTNTDD